MSVPVLVALAAVIVASFVRWRRRHGAIDLEAVVLVPAMSLLLVGIAATLLATARVLGPGSLTAVALGIAIATWPWRTMPLPLRPSPSWPRMLAIGLGVCVLGGVALRLPPQDYALAGRDQGTYTLRAEHIAGTGALDLRDELLAEASHAQKKRAGPADLLGLFPTGRERWRKDRYEGAYRPGLYLADRHRGRVVPQLFHLQPAAMASARLAAGDLGPLVLLVLMGAWSLLAVAAVGRRLWSQGPWALLPVALLAIAPLPIWVHRSALSETPALLLLCGAALAGLRARDGDRDGLALAAVLLGGAAWVRGHGLLVAPAVAVVLLALPRMRRETAMIYGAMVLGSLLVHAGTTYPYLHDELQRMVPDLHPGPGAIVAVALAFVLAWDGAHRLVEARRRSGGARWIEALAARAPAWLVGIVAVSVVAWLVLRTSSPAKPFARLDCIVVMVGPVVLGAAAIGAWFVGRGRLSARPSHVWLAAIGVALVLPVALYARRNLPQGGLYYYGRYLVPEIWPACAMLATEAVRRLHLRLSPTMHRDRIAWAGAVILVAATAMPLVTHPVTRIREFAGVRAVVDGIASVLPPDAIVIAGGEGWHHGHTFNQVGGALQLSHGVSVLPYRSREAAYATLHELLVAAEAPRPVYLLVNEATKPYRRRNADGKPAGPKLAAFDDVLPAPFAAVEVRPFEMFVHRLTPVSDAVPTRVTRDELRMVLVRVVVDPTLAAATERFDPPGGTDPRCLDPKKKTTITLPPGPAGRNGPVALVLVASPGTSSTNADWVIEADGRRLSVRAVGEPKRPRDTLGPFVLPARPHALAIRGAKRRRKKAACRYGGIDEIRVLPVAMGVDDGLAWRGETYGPPRDLGHPVEPSVWVAGRGLSRKRPGIVSEGGKLKHAGPSLVLVDGQTLTFPYEPMPGDGGPIDVMVTLSRSEAGPDRTLELLVDGQVVERIEVPEARKGSWQSEPLRLDAPPAIARLSVRLAGPEGGEGRVWLRDLGLFSRAAEHPSELATPR